MSEKSKKSNIIRVSPLMIAILAIWFTANLISQLLFISHYGNPYDGISMLASLGPIYYAIIIAELILWAWLVVFFIIKLLNLLKNEQSTGEIGNHSPVTKTVSTL